MFNIAICDDERKEAKTIKTMLETFLKEHLLIYNIHIFTSGEALLASSENFDFIFLDISMEGINGIETGMKLYQKSRKIRLIYITGYQEYCKDAVNHAHAFAYLSKPVAKEQLAKQVSELIKEIGEDKGNEIEIELLNVTRIGEDDQKIYPIVQIPISHILYVEYVKAGRKIRVRTKTEIYEYSGTMAELEQKMKLYDFETCYRGILVNFEHVMKVKGDTIYLVTGEKLPLSQKRRTEFREQLSNYVHRSIL